jgi:hypothetical protein
METWRATNVWQANSEEYSNIQPEKKTKHRAPKDKMEESEA